jgi:hypothetical protein
MNTKTLAALAIAAALSACVTVQDAGPAPRQPPPAPPPPPSLTKIYFYPQQGQSEAQQDRDRYECFNWSVRQTGFDPSQRLAPRELRATVVPARPAGEKIAAGAVLGAVLGATVAGHGDRGEGAAVGAVAGSIIGAASASNDQARTEQVERRYNNRDYREYERQAGEYRRAMSACLTGRGYSVQ